MVPFIYNAIAYCILFIDLVLFVCFILTFLFILCRLHWKHCTSLTNNVNIGIESFVKWVQNFYTLIITKVVLLVFRFIFCLINFVLFNFQELGIISWIITLGGSGGVHRTLTDSLSIAHTHWRSEMIILYIQYMVEDMWRTTQQQTFVHIMDRKKGLANFGNWTQHVMTRSMWTTDIELTKKKRFMSLRS